jgi:hypothetical protein
MAGNSTRRRSQSQRLINMYKKLLPKSSLTGFKRGTMAMARSSKLKVKRGGSRRIRRKQRGGNTEGVMIHGGSSNGSGPHAENALATAV